MREMLLGEVGVDTGTDGLEETIVVATGGDTTLQGVQHGI